MGPSSRAAAAAAAASSSSASVGNASRKNHRAKSSKPSSGNGSSSSGGHVVTVRDNTAEMTDDEYLDYIGNYKPGTLRTIRLTNFLTHKDVVIRPGPR
jgi:hypothetical protein